MSKDDADKNNLTAGVHDGVSDGATPPSANSTRSAYEEYLYGRSIFSDYKLKPNWSSTTQGRVAIRLVSRGVFGALAFAFANRYATNQLRGYEPDTFKWGEANFIGKDAKPLQYVAKTFDVMAGKPIQAFMRTIAPVGQKEIWAQSTTRFRLKAYFHPKAGGPVGRSLGSEVVAVTFDFSAMSLADALARNVIQAFDPNLPQPWFVDKNGHAAIRGKGRFDLQQWGKAVFRSTWRSVTKNAGEDWAAALPYIYQMKWQREALSKIPAFSTNTRESGKAKQFEGFKIVSDRSRNGGSLLINRQGKIVGDYQLPGLLDLQGRFVGYNVYTLIYREMYDWIGRQVYHVYKHGFHFDKLRMPDNPLEAAVESIGNTGRYLIKSAIKANLFMQPAVPFFWLFRTPQSKWRSEILLEGADPKQNYVGTWKPQKNGIPDPHRKGVHRFNYPMRYEDWVRPQKGLTGAERPKFLYFGKEKVPFPASLKEKGVYHFDNCPTITSKLLNPFGWICYTTGSGLTRLVDAVVPMNSPLSRLLAGTGELSKNAAERAKQLSKMPLERTVLLRSYADAAWAYTPYFIAKDEFGLRVNDTPATGELGKMDKAIYGLIDNMFTFRFKKAGSSVKDIWRLSTDSLEKQSVTHFEGKKIVKEDENGTPNPADTTKAVPAPTEAAPKPLKIQPATKVQATSVQYNVTPPTHLKHETSVEATQRHVSNAQKEGEVRWADMFSDRKSEVTQSTNPTVH